eukprot:m.155724 g.155724  ORF g.155724 m.155724 type:complete len:97 (-) comp11721_c0_seq32:2169-2459(-)
MVSGSRTAMVCEAQRRAVEHVRGQVCRLTGEQLCEMDKDDFLRFVDNNPRGGVIFNDIAKLKKQASSSSDSSPGSAAGAAAALTAPLAPCFGCVPC